MAVVQVRCGLRGEMLLLLLTWWLLAKSLVRCYQDNGTCGQLLVKLFGGLEPRRIAKAFYVQLPGSFSLMLAGCPVFRPGKWLCCTVQLPPTWLVHRTRRATKCPLVAWPLALGPCCAHDSGATGNFGDIGKEDMGLQTVFG